MVLEEYLSSNWGLISFFLFILFGIGAMIFFIFYKKNLNEKWKSRLTIIILSMYIVLLLLLVVLAFRFGSLKQYIRNQPADMIVSTRKSGLMLRDNYVYFKVNTKYQTQKKINESEFNELMELYGERQNYENEKKKIILSDDRYNESNITKVFPFKDYIYYIFVDEDRKVYTLKYNTKTNEKEEFVFNYEKKGIRDLEGNVIVSEYPDLYSSIKEILSEKNEVSYHSTRYINGRIIFVVLDASPKGTSYRCLYEFIPETKETKLLVKFEKTNIEDIAFIQ